MEPLPWAGRHHWPYLAVYAHLAAIDTVAVVVVALMAGIYLPGRLIHTIAVYSSLLRRPVRGSVLSFRTFILLKYLSLSFTCSSSVTAALSGHGTTTACAHARPADWLSQEKPSQVRERETLTVTAPDTVSEESESASSASRQQLHTSATLSIRCSSRKVARRQGGYKFLLTYTCPAHLPTSGQTVWHAPSRANEPPTEGDSSLKSPSNPTLHQVTFISNHLSNHHESTCAPPLLPVHLLGHAQRCLPY